MGQVDRQMDRPNEMPKGIKTSPFTLNHHMLASFRTFFSFAGPLNKKKDLPSLNSWTCWRNCQSETAVCLTPDISGSLQSRCSPLVSLPIAFVLWPLPPFCSPPPDLGQPSPFHAPTSLPPGHQPSLPGFCSGEPRICHPGPWSLLLPWLPPCLSLPDEGWCPSESGPQVQGDALNPPLLGRLLEEAWLSGTLPSRASNLSPPWHLTASRTLCHMKTGAGKVLSFCWP